MVLYKIYVSNGFPPFETFLGDFTDINSAKAVIKGFHDTQHRIIDYPERFESAGTFEALERTGNIKIHKWIVGETNSERGVLQWKENMT